MKTTLAATILLSGAILVSCSKENATTEPGMPASIEFKISAESAESAETRGTPINPGTGTNQALANGKTFDIRGHKGTDNDASIIDFATVVSNSSATLSATHNWPTPAVDMKFWGVHPRQSSVGSTNTTMTITDFTIKTNFAEQEDLLYTYALQNSATKTAVPLVFRHALTRVTFQMKLTGTNSTFTNVYVSKVELRNAFDKGTAIISNTPSVTSWTGSQRNTVSTGTITSTQAKRLDTQTGTGDASVDSPGGTGAGYWNIFADANANNSFLMIPMTTTELNASGTATAIDVYFSVNGVERGPYTISGLGAKGAWTHGKHINYRLTFDMAKEVIAIGGVTVASWGNVTNYDFDLN